MPPCHAVNHATLLADAHVRSSIARMHAAAADAVYADMNRPNGPTLCQTLTNDATRDAFDIMLCHALLR